MVWVLDYVVGSTYKVKLIKAETAEQAIKKARVKNIVDLQPSVGYDIFAKRSEYICRNDMPT